MIIPFTKKFYKQLILAVAAIFMATMGAMTAFSSAAVVQGCDFDNSLPGTWSLVSDCTSTAQINIPTGVTVQGNNHTISPNWPKTDNSNNSVLGIIDVDTVTVNNLTIDGTGGTNLHGILAYASDNININNVAILNNDHSGLVVNGSTVTVNNITTGGNGWNGVDVDLGSGVTGPAVLTVNGVSHHTDTAHIYVDDTTKAVSVVDTNSQYAISHPGIQTNDRLYTLIPLPVKVTIDKYIDTNKATTTTANNSSFPMASSWSADNIGPGSGTYGLGPVGFNSANPYEAVTSDMTKGASYSTNEVTGGAVVAATCTPGGAPYALVGYSTGDTLLAAQGASKSTTAPAFTNLQTDKFVIVWNMTCPTPPTHPTNKDQCKNDGWKTFSNPSFKNQGKCIEYVEKHGSANEVQGTLRMSGPSQKIIFNINGKNDDQEQDHHSDKSWHKSNKDTVEYWNYEYLGGTLHFKADVMCVGGDKSTGEARVMFQIPAGHPGLSGLYVVSYVKEVKNGTDLYGHTSTSDLTTATAWCQTGVGFAPVMYPVTQGKVEIN